MLRRDIRLRKEFLFRKSQEENDRRIHEKKQRIKKALDENKPIPSDIKAEAVNLAEALSYDENLEGPQSLADNEYSRAGNYDPKVLITTSRDPSSRLQQFAKELRLIFPNSQRINRGNHVISELVTACKSNDVTDLVILHEHRGVPDGIIISHFPHGPTAFFTLSNVVLRHDIPEAMEKKVSEAFPHLIFSNFTTNIGNRTKTILKHLFPVPKDDSKRVISMINQKDYISFRHHVFKPSRKEVEMVEIGPRFEMKLFQVKLGTVDMDEADTEWVLRPYMNTTKKRTYL